MICVSYVMRNTIVPLVEEVPGKAALKEPAFTADALPAVAVRGAAGAARARAGAGEGGGRADCGDQTQSSDELDGLVQHDVLLFWELSHSMSRLEPFPLCWIDERRSQD
jgi:hypothetical protein